MNTKIKVLLAIGALCTGGIATVFVLMVLGRGWAELSPIIGLMVMYTYFTLSRETGGRALLMIGGFVVTYLSFAYFRFQLGVSAVLSAMIASLLAIGIVWLTNRKLHYR